MNVVITSEVLQAYSLCPRKAYLLMYGKDKGTLHEYEQILRRHQLANQSKSLELFKQKSIDVYPYSVSNLQEGYEFLIDANLATDKFQANCSILTRVDNLSYEPTVFIGTHTINNTDKLSLMFAGYILTKIQGKLPAVGHIVNMKGESRRLKLEESQKVLMPLLEPLQEWLDESSPEEPPVILNKHCHICQFKEQCKAKAIQEDSLSRLDHVTPKAIRQYERKGIFTVRQLSYLFKPRKRKKRSKSPPPVIHSVELQALAIRESKIYLKDLPEICREELEIFLDIEGNPDEGNYYLIGILVCQENLQKYSAFWADGINDEEKIWHDFLDLVNQYPNAPIYHYGSYEPKALAKLTKAYETDTSSLSKRLVNLNSFIYGKIYFPTYSNQLKEIGHFIGAKWTSSSASGLQALVWRNNWEETHVSTYKESLLTYNKEDCEALKLLIDRLSQIKQSADCQSDCQSEIEFADKHQHPKNEAKKGIHTQLRSVLKFSYLDCDKKKISFRQEEEKEDYETKRERNKSKSRNHKQKLIKLRSKVQKVTRIPLREVCPECGHKPLSPCKLETKRLIIDLTLNKSGIKRIMKELVGVYEYCSKCRHPYPPLFGYKASQIYGHGVKAWITYHRVALRLPYESISESLDEQFKEKISSGSIPRLIKDLATYYTETESSIIQHLLGSSFIHADETQISIQGINWYIWVFTNGQYVHLKLRETREATVVHDLLTDYKGVLISDFYSGYDSIKCTQQKCWVHLIRDLNNDLCEAIFDAELEKLVLDVRDLIIPIMECIQKNGLRQRHLKKFKEDVEHFYEKSIVNIRYKSDLAAKYQKRFIRYKGSLFTFLEKDGISWHNNPAEWAIRPIAKQRAISSSFTASAIEDYLVLLGIRQTCRSQGKSFFKFLFSGETDLDQFEARKRKR